MKMVLYTSAPNWGKQSTYLNTLIFFNMVVTGNIGEEWYPWAELQPPKISWLLPCAKMRVDNWNLQDHTERMSAGGNTGVMKFIVLTETATNKHITEIANSIPSKHKSKPMQL